MRVLLLLSILFYFFFKSKYTNFWNFMFKSHFCMPFIQFFATLIPIIDCNFFFVIYLTMSTVILNYIHQTIKTQLKMIVYKKVKWPLWIYMAKNFNGNSHNLFMYQFMSFHFFGITLKFYLSSCWYNHSFVLKKMHTMSTFAWS